MRPCVFGGVGWGMKGVEALSYVFRKLYCCTNTLSIWEYRWLRTWRGVDLACVDGSATAHSHTHTLQRIFWFIPFSEIIYYILQFRSLFHSLPLARSLSFSFAARHKAVREMVNARDLNYTYRFWNVTKWMFGEAAAQTQKTIFGTRFGDITVRFFRIFRCYWNAIEADFSATQLEYWGEKCKNVSVNGLNRHSSNLLVGISANGDGGRRWFNLIRCYQDVSLWKLHWSIWNCLLGTHFDSAKREQCGRERDGNEKRAREGERGQQNKV